MSKVVLVTGASRGIGRAIAEKFVQDGYNVIGTSTSENSSAKISEYGARPYVLNVNCGLKDLQEKYIDEISKIYDSAPDILINNAGITRDSLLLRLSEDDWDEVIATNLSSVYKLSKIASSAMTKKRWGRIISIGSIIGAMGNAGQANYAAAKAGLEGVSKSLARELARRNVTVNVVAPGFIETDMTKAMTDEQIKKLCAPIPMQKTGKPADVAHLVAFLASEYASYITGASIPVNGGLLMP